MPLNRGAPDGTPPPGPAPCHSPQPRNLRPLQRPPTRAPQPLCNEWERTVELHLSRIQEAPDTDTKVEAICTLRRLHSICLTVSPSKGKHRRILVRLQTAQYHEPHSEAPEPITSGPQRARHRNRRPAQPFQRTLVTRMHSYNQAASAVLHAACRPYPLPPFHPRSCSNSLHSTPTRILPRSLPLTWPLFALQLRYSALCLLASAKELPPTLQAGRVRIFLIGL
jgi:hypothetical protein